MAHASTQGIDRYAFLGDFVGYGADPWLGGRPVRDHMSTRRHRRDGQPRRRGGAGPLPTMMIPEAREVVEWTRERARCRTARLSRRDADVGHRRRSPVRARQRLRAADWAYVLGRMEAVRSLQSTNAQFTFCGHVHDPSCSISPAPARSATSCPATACPSRCRSSAAGWSSPARPASRATANPPPATPPSTRSAAPHLLPRAYDTRSAGAKIRAAGLPQRLAHDDSNMEAVTRSSPSPRAPASALAAGQVIDGSASKNICTRAAWPPVARHARRCRAGRGIRAADHEGAAHQGRRRPGHHRRLRGRADDHADALPACTCRSSSPGRLHAPALHRDGAHPRHLAARAASTPRRCRWTR